MTAEPGTDDFVHPAAHNLSRSRVPQAVPHDLALHSPRQDHTLLADAVRAAGRGNDVRAAILHMRAADSSTPALALQAAAFAAADIRRARARLEQALRIEPSRTNAWRDLLAALLERAVYGFWNPSARLLYDLQKVCLDAERESYVVDLLRWVFSLGRRPLKRLLPAAARC